MFEVGKKYEVRRIVGGGEMTQWATIEKYEHPLVKFADVDLSDSPFAPASGSPLIRGEIINVTSPNFISAVLKEE